MRARRFSLSNLSIKHRLPLLIGLLLLAIILASTWASYLGVRDSALEAGHQRLLNLTQQLASLSQQSTALLLGKTVAAANDPAIRNFLQSRSPAARPAASAILQQFTSANDPNSLQVELWNDTPSLVLTNSDGSPPEGDLNGEFKLCAVDPFKTVGSIRLVNNIVAYPALAAVKNDFGKTIGFLVRWRRVSSTPEGRKQIENLLGSEAALYFGNASGDVWTDLEKVVHGPPAGLQSTLQLTRYARNGSSVMALGRPIGGTPFFVVVEFPDSVFLSQARQFLRRMMVIDLVMIALGVTGGFALSRSIARPLHSLTVAATTISGGDYFQTVNISQQDELGALGNAFNSMVVRLRGSQSELEKKIAELKMAHESASKSAAIVESSHDAILGKTLDGTITSWNKGAEELYGYSAAEVIGRSIAILVPPKNPDEVPAILERLRRGESIDHYETERVTKDKSRVWVSLTISPIKDASGRISGASMIARDITKRQRAEAAQRTSELRYRRLFESAKDGILILEAREGRIVDVNPFLAKMLDYAKEDLVGRKLWEIGLFKDVVASKLAFAELKQEGYIRYEDLPLKTRGGVVKQVEFVSNSYLEGETRVIQCNIRDITERKRSEAAVNTSEGRYRALFECAPDGIVIGDSESYYIDANASMCRMLGYTRAELTGLNASDIVAQSEIEHIGSALSSIKAESGYHREWQFRRKDGSIFSAEVISTMMPDGNLLGLVRDVTDRKQAEEALQKKVEELATMSQHLWQASKLATMGELSASIAHELNNPLATVALRAEAMMEGLPPDDPQFKSLKIISQEVDRMARLVSNLLLFSRRSQSQISTLNLCEELTNSLDFIHYHMRSRRVSIVKDFAAFLPTVHADRQQLRQVFLNLLTNASDAMPEGGILTVRAQPGLLSNGGEAVVVEFSDTGIGIEPELLPKLFETFFTTKPEGIGTGLGLPICRRIIEQHRGTIVVDSAVGTGTTVRITMPVTETGVPIQSD